jgi:HemY protein
MIRILLFLGLVLALGFGFSWFADRPGDVILVWQGNRYETSLMVVLTLLVALVATIMIAWWTVSIILRSPSIMRRFYRNRQRDRGYHALSTGLIAASSGDAAQARKLVRDSRKLLGDESLVKLLEAQTLILEGNRSGARELFTKMLDDDNTRLVALRGLYVEAEREGEKEASRHYAEEAAKLSTSLPWAGGALLKYQAAAGDFEAALRTLESNRAGGLIGKAEAERKRAVLLTAQAIADEPSSPDKAIKAATQALRLAPDFVPAVTAAALAYGRKNDIKRASRLIEDLWRSAPHREAGEAYLALKSGGTLGERLERAKRLMALSPDHPESRMLVGAAAIEALDFRTAREALAPLLNGAEPRRLCLLMAQLEKAETRAEGRTRQWLAKALHAPADPAWVADGQASHRWLPFSPLTGEIGAYEWKVPPLALAAPDGLSFDDTDDDVPVTVSEISERDAEKPVEAIEVTAAGHGAAREGEALAKAPDDPGIDAAPVEEPKSRFRLF